MITMAAEIISYQPLHQPDLEAFFHRVWLPTRFPFDPAGAHSDLRQIAHYYQAGGGDFWLLMRAGEIVGTLALRALSNSVGEVKRFNVRADLQGRGYGETLLRYAIDQAREGGFECVRLDTIRNPGPALPLFEKFGFAEIEPYNTNPDADLFMELRL